MKKPLAWTVRLARELGRPERLAVLGVGNTARGDDAAGVRAAEGLAALAAAGAMPRLKVFVTHEVPENFTGAVREFGPSHVLVIDAVAAGSPPGTVFIVDPAAVPEEDLSTHRTPLSTLAGYLERTVGCRAVILGIEPAAFAAGTPLSPAVRRAVERVAASLARFASHRLRSSSASGRRYS
ncbi:MAG TPA: hydrogenase 3 maturation endopeptidase HyCI [Burkholderiales bacterium]|nr:hydrogenase 3 maturation endopeptidase HyCI [Burkholderiales bacterium]